MQAKFIRGQDPKRSLGIGLRTINLQYLKLHGGAGSIIKDPPFIKKFLSDYVPDMMKRTDENPTMAPSVIFIDEDKRSYTLNYLWSNKFNGAFYDGEYYSFGKYRKLEESIGFQRGGDTRDSMKIGIRSSGLYAEGIYKQMENSKLRVSDREAHTILDNIDLYLHNDFLIRKTSEPGDTGVTYYALSYLKLQTSKKYEYIIFDNEIYKIRR
jgi:hypothetical protein